MIAVIPRFMGLTLLAALCPWPNAHAHADVVETLSNVTFADGSTASGYFVINSYGYFGTVDITTTSGTTTGQNSVAGYTFDCGSVSNPSFDSIFSFSTSTAPDAIYQVLDVQQVLTPSFSNYDQLIAGSGSGGTLAGSFEECLSSQSSCNGVPNQDSRLITSGAIYAPEPATLTLLGDC